jgi:hypothetical protein
VDIDLTKIDTSDLINELLEREIVSAKYAARLKEREGIVADIVEDWDALQDAIDYAKRGDLVEALVHLGRAIPDLHKLSRLTRNA